MAARPMRLKELLERMKESGESEAAEIESVVSVAMRMYPAKERPDVAESIASQFEYWAFEVKRVAKLEKIVLGAEEEAKTAYESAIEAIEFKEE